MIEARRRDMVNALMGSVPDRFEGIALAEMERMCGQDIDDLEPIIDRMLIAAFKAGQKNAHLLSAEEIVECLTAHQL